MLDECGIRERKTKSEIEEERLKCIEKNKKYIIEQYSDGVSVRNIGDSLRASHLKLIQRYPERKNNNVTINIQGNTQLYHMLSELYSDDDINNICMQRKYQRFLMIKKQQERKEASA